MMDLFGEDGPRDTHHYDGLRERYLAKAKAKVLDALGKKIRASYEDVLELMDSVPMAWGSDLKGWIAS